MDLGKVSSKHIMILILDMSILLSILVELFPIYRHLRAFYSALTPSKAKITNFDRTVLIYKYIGWLQISVQNIGCVKVLDRTQQVIDDSLDVLDLQVDC